MRPVLVTGFEPFGGRSSNPSGDAIRRLERSGRHPRARFAVLPVERRQAWAALERLLERESPRALVLTGLAVGRSALSFEAGAANRYLPARGGPARPVVAGGPDRLAATLSSRRTLRSLRSTGLPAHVSSDAGTYTCNATLYLALAWARDRRRAGKPAPAEIGFLHVPPTPELADPGVTPVGLEELETALDALVAELCAELCADHGA